MTDIKSIPGFWNGISQQAPAMRKENQAESQLNAYGTLVNGLEKRRGSSHLAVLDTSSSSAAFANAMSWTLDLGTNGVFVVVAVDDMDDPIQIFDLDGVKQTVNFETRGNNTVDSYDAATDAITITSHGYFDGDLVRYVQGAANIAPLVHDTQYYIVNKTADTFQLALTAGGAAINLTGTGGSGDFRLWSAADYFRGSAAINRRIRAVTIGSQMVFANREFVVAVDETVPTVTSKTIESYSAGDDDITITAHGYSNGDRVQYQQLSGLAITPLVNNAIYFVVDKDTDYFSVALTSGGAAIDLTGSGGGGQFRTGSIIAGVVQTFSDLPDSSDVPAVQPNDIYRVQGSDSNQAKYYVKWDGSVWVEDANPEESNNRPDDETMPVALTYDPVGADFDLKKQVWAGREAGDAETNPVPSFNGQTINGLFYARGRFGMLSGNNILFSQVGAAGYTNFYPTRVIDVLDDDPIDIAVSADNLDVLRSVVSVEKSIVAFADRTQFSIGSGDSSVLSVSTIAVDPTTRFEIEPNHIPFAAGSNILFLCQTPQFLTMREYFVNEDTLQADAADITIHVPKLMLSGDGQVVGLNVLDVAFVKVTSVPNSVYVYKYYWINDEKLQSAWSEWTFDGKVLTLTSYEKSLYMLTEREGEVCLETIDVEGDIDPTLNIHLHLDRKVTLVDAVDVVYSAGTDLTTFTLPYEPVDGDLVNLVCPATSAVLYADDLTQSETNPERFTATGDHTGANWIAGVNFSMLYELSQFYLRNEQGGALHGGRISLRRLWLEYRDTGYFEVEAIAEGRDTRDEMSVSLSGNLDAITDYDTLNIVDGADKFPIFLNSRDAKVNIRNDTFMPCQIVSGAWEYLFTPRIRPVG